MTLVLGDRELKTAEDALALLDDEVAGLVVSPGAMPDGWPGSWLDEATLKHPEWGEELVRGIANRGQQADASEQFIWRKLLANINLELPIQFECLLAGLMSSERGSQEALQWLNETTQAAGRQGAGADSTQAAAAAANERPDAWLVYAAIDWPAVADRCEAGFANCSVEELQMGGSSVVLAPAATLRALQAISALDDDRKRALRHPITNAGRIYGEHNKPLKTLVQQLLRRIDSE